MYVYSAERQEGGRDLPGDEEPGVHEQARAVGGREEVRGQVHRHAQEVRVRREVHVAGVARQAGVRPVLRADGAGPRRRPHRLAARLPDRRRDRPDRGHQPVLRRDHLRRAPRLHEQVRGGHRAVEGHGGAADQGQPAGHADGPRRHGARARPAGAPLHVPQREQVPALQLPAGPIRRVRLLDQRRRRRRALHRLPGEPPPVPGVDRQEERLITICKVRGRIYNCCLVAEFFDSDCR